MSCKKILCDGFSSYKDIVFPERELADCLSKFSCCASYRSKVIIAIAISFFMGFLKPIILPIATSVALLILPVKSLVAFFQSRKFVHYSVSWALCLLTTALIIISIGLLLVFAPSSVMFSLLGLCIAFCAVTSFIQISDRILFPEPPKKVLPTVPLFI